jgi:hypothetical protein
MFYNFLFSNFSIYENLAVIGGFQDPDKPKSLWLLCYEFTKAEEPIRSVD